jgi:hypothetical protein
MTRDLLEIRTRNSQIRLVHISACWGKSAGLHPQSPRHFARQLSARVSQTLRSSYLSHMTAAAT